MRLKSDPQVYFQWPSSSDRKVVKEYREKHNAISELLDKNPQVLDLAHRDLEKLSEATKREKRATYTVENILRALIVHNMEGMSLRKTIVRIAKPFCSMPADALSLELTALCEDIRYFVPAVRQVVSVAHRIHIKGEAVPAKEKIYSIFEQHVELIKRGKRGKPVEFGHKIVLSETKDKFITDYEVMERQVSDSNLTEPVIEGHEELFGSPPDVVAGDGGFWSGEEKMKELGKRVKTLAIPKNVKEWATKILPAWQRFRAGIEGTISVLKRVFGLMRCPYRGFRNFASSVGLGIFCHNLVCLVGATKE